MKPDKPLVNPSLEDFKEEEVAVNEEKIPVLKGQIHMDLGNDGITPKKIVGVTKMKMRKRAAIMEFSSMWRNPSLPFSISAIVTTALIILVGAIIEYDRIPPRIPLFFNPSTNRWDQFDKSFVFIFPVIFFLVQLFVVHLTIKIFNYDKKLSISISWILVFLNILLLVSVGQIYTLIT